MTSRDFCYWLQGVFEVTKPVHLDTFQTDAIRRHLALVFKHEIDPQSGDAKHQVELNAIHDAPQLGGVDPITGMIVRC